MTLRNRESFRFEPLKMLRPSEEVARRIANAVREGHFRDGDRLPSERNLADQLDVSRPTVREAQRLLVEAGIIEVKAGAAGGAFIISEHVPFDLLTSTLTMRPGEMYEALELRRLILPWVAQISARHAEDDDFDRMRDAIQFGRAQLARIDAADVSREDAQLVVIASMRFDLAMARATRNALVLRLMNILLRWLEPMRLMTLQTAGGLTRAVDVIEDTLRALESGDRNAVAAVIDTRLRVLEDALEQQSGRMPRRKRGAQLAADVS